MTLRVRIRLTTGHPNLLDQMLLTSLSSMPTPECLPPKFCRWTNLRWANVLPNVVQHGNHAVLRAGSCPGTAVFGAVSCKQTFCRTIVQKQWAESPWPVPPCGVSPTLWTKSVSSSQGYGHVKAHHCTIVKFWLQSWWACAWIPPQPTHIRPLICSISIFVLLPLVPAMSKVLLSNELVAWVLRDFQRTVFQTSWQTHPMKGVDAMACYCTETYSVILSSVPGMPNNFGVRLPSTAWILSDVAFEFGNLKICELHCHALAFSCVVNGKAGPTV